MKKIYLCSPYSHPDPETRDARYEAVCKKAAQLMLEGYVVFSPIAHSHNLSKYIGNPNDADFYLNQDLPFIAACDELWILMLPGYASSKGIKAEIAEARRLGKAIRFVEEGG